MTNRDFHDCTRACTPDTCKVQAQERFMDRRDGDDGLPTKCCGRCRHYDPIDAGDGRCKVTDYFGWLPTDSCLAFELKDF